MGDTGVRFVKATDRAGEEDERVFEGRHEDAVDMPEDDPVIARWVLGDDVALEGGERVGDQRHAARPEFPVDAGETVRAGWRSAPCEALVPVPQHVDAEALRPPHSRPSERAAGRTERDQGRLQRDGRERADDESSRFAVRQCRDERDARGKPPECVAERARARLRVGTG
jgi:hypothetical protein